MNDYDLILDLYRSVIYEDKNSYNVLEEDIIKGCNDMRGAYKPNQADNDLEFLDVVDYRNPSHRIAYLHKFASMHTALVADMFEKAIEANLNFFHNFLSNSQDFNICSLGGGPGSDILGTLLVLNKYFGIFKSSACIVDLIPDWKQTFWSIIQELRYGRYGQLGEMVNSQNFVYSYVGANLLGPMTPDVHKAIASSNFVSMIKFVSAASCKNTGTMLKKIFQTMKPGAILLYIDKSGGGFHQLVRREAEECNFQNVFGPIKHFLFSNEVFSVKRFGVVACFETRITMQIWIKPYPDNLHNYHFHTEVIINTAQVNKHSNQGSSRRSRSRSRSRNRQGGNQYRPAPRQVAYNDHRNVSSSNESVEDHNEDMNCCVIL